MRKVAIALFVIQIVALFGGMASGNLAAVFSGGVFKLLGYFLPCIIGMILYVKSNKKEKR